MCLDHHDDEEFCKIAYYLSSSYVPLANFKVFITASICVYVLVANESFRIVTRFIQRESHYVINLSSDKILRRFFTIFSVYCRLEIYQKRR